MKIDLLTTQYHTFAFYYPFNMGIVDFCRMLKESWGWQEMSFDATHKAWVFSKPEILAAIVAKYPACEVTPAAEAFAAQIAGVNAEWEELVGVLDGVKDAKDSDIKVHDLKGTLYPFQKVGVEFLMKTAEARGGNIRAILADDPGLGKTAQSIATMLARKSDRTLVICPATMKYTWEAEINKWSGIEPFVIDTDSDLNSFRLYTQQAWIINYDLLKKFLPELMKFKFDMMVLDEAHYIKTANTIRSRSVRLLAKGIKDIIMLTGTPVLNRPVEIFNPLNILDPKEWNNYFRFVDKFCGAKHTRFGLDVSGATNIESLKAKLDTYMIRRRKEEVLDDLPDKVRVEIPVVLKGSSAKTYFRAYNNFAKFLRESKGKTDVEVIKALQAEKLTKINALREIAAQGKLDDARELIDTVVNNGQKIIVFASFVAPLEQLKEELGDQAVLLTGKTPNEQRFEIVKAFQTDPNIKVFLGGIKSAGVGITLTEASNVLFLDYSWTPADHKQAEDRAHRIGSKHDSITIYQMRARGTMDDIMFKMLEKKRDIVESIVGEGDDQSAMQMVMEEITNQALNEENGADNTD